jgi:transposase
MEKKISLELVNPYAAGIDVGSRIHLVSIGQKAEDVQEFGVYTEDYEKMITWLCTNQIKTVAMESTGSYWQTLFVALQTAGFEVLLVNGRDIKNVKGKKTDVMDCMWIQQLHSLGLLRGSFLPDEATRQLRSFYAHRESLIAQRSKYSLKMQQSLRLMNLRLDVVLRDIMGKSGQDMIKAILAGNRNAQYLASLADIRVKKSQQEIAKALQGDWKEDLLFILGECWDMYQYYSQKILVVDKQIENLLKDSVLSKPSERKLPEVTPKKAHKNKPSFDLRTLAYQFFGVDFYQIGGVSDTTVLCLLSTLGDGIDHFPSVKHFVSWLRLAPHNKISGGKILSSRTPKGKNSLALALRQAANAIGNMKTHPLKSFFNKIAYKKGRGAAITATARKLAIIIYQMLTKKEEFNPDYYDQQVEKNRLHKLIALKKKMVALNLNQEEIKLFFDQ